MGKVTSPEPKASAISGGNSQRSQMGGVKKKRKGKTNKDDYQRDIARSKSTISFMQGGEPVDVAWSAILPQYMKEKPDYR